MIRIYYILFYFYKVFVVISNSCIYFKRRGLHIYIYELQNQNFYYIQLIFLYFTASIKLYQIIFDYIFDKYINIIKIINIHHNYQI